MAGHGRAAWVAVAVFRVLCTGLLFGATLAYGQRRDLITNGGFEEGTAGWIPDPGHVLIEAPDAAHSGNACLAGEVTRPRTHLQLTRRVPVSSRNLYEFVIWARATNRTKLVLWLQKPGQPNRTMGTAWENLPNTWKRFALPISVPEDGELELQIISPSAHGAPPGKIWIDDIALYETVMPATTTLTAADEFADEPALAAAPDGSLYAAWTSFRDGRDSLRAARLQPDGDSIHTVATWDVAAPSPKTFVLYPQLIASPQEVTLLYAQEQRESSWQIQCVGLTPHGPGAAISVTDGDSINIKPDAAWQDDTLWIAWESNRDGSRGVWLAAVRNGRAGPAERVSLPDGSAYSPSVAVLADGGLAVAWHQFRGHTYDIYLRRRGADGTWHPEQRLTASPAVDRDARLFRRGDELWICYENAVSKGYRVGATNRRRLCLARVHPDGTLMAPLGLHDSPLAGRSEGAVPFTDAGGVIRVLHLRPRGQRSGWDIFLTGHNGSAWGELQRMFALLGMDRRPAAARIGNRLFVAAQRQAALRHFDNEEEAAKDASVIQICAVDLDDPAAAGTLRLEPLTEPETDFEAHQIRVAFGDDTAGIPTIDYRGRQLKLVYGDLHEHTDVSQCNRLGDQSIDESYQHMRDICSLDFAAATDHGYNITPYLWSYLAKMARVNNDPGRFVTFLGEEWTSTFEEYSDEHPYGFYGHRNLILADPYFPRWWNARNRQTPAEVWQQLREMRANFVHIPHQIADTGNVPVDWNFADEEAQPVAEILQVRGSYEYKGAPREAGRTTPPGYFMQDAWARGIVIGVIASPDHGGGIGKACVFTQDMTREAILDALRARHCFATTAARVFLDVRVNGHLMGEKIPAPEGPVTVAVNVRCPADIARVEICRNNTFIYSREPGQPNTRFTFRDPAPVAGQSYYYVRVMQADDEIAWSSPVWLGYD